MKQLLLIVFLAFSLFSISQEMRIGLLRSLKIRSVECVVKSGQYSIYGDSVNLGSFKSLTCSLTDQGVKCSYDGKEYVFSIIQLRAEKTDGIIQVTSISPSSKSHQYKDDIELSRESSVRMRVVNKVDMNNYLAGVIESEGGGGRHVEYYKVQALMSRTYAMKNKDRHKKEGFYLCDGVHCQAYHNKLTHTPSIQEAVDGTTGMVIIDNESKLVTSYFSANCGGQTCDASYVWNSSVPYLESFIDTFCIHTRQATWTKSVSKIAWKTFLEKEYGVTEGVYGDLIYNFYQDQRKAFYIHPSLGVPLRDLREKFSLKSTYFSTHLEGENVIIEGRGFGHGVGLCQEGAMNMAKAGITYQQIALFYFKDVQIIDYFKNYFYGQETNGVINQ